MGEKRGGEERERERGVEGIKEGRKGERDGKEEKE